MKRAPPTEFVTNEAPTDWIVWRRTNWDVDGPNIA